jgi:hypothetical protein
MARDQGSKPTPTGFRYYRQGLHLPSSVAGSKKRGRVLTRSEVYAEINKKLAEHADATFGKIRVDEPLKKPPFSRSEEDAEKESKEEKAKKAFMPV